MAIVKNDPFPGTDYSSYQKWEKVVLPSGEVLYTVPGNPAYVFDPVASNATGRKVFRRNPKEAIAQDQLQREQQQKAIEQQQFNQSPLGQLIPVGASLGGLYAANQIAGMGAPSLGGLFGGGSAGTTIATQAIPEVTALGGGASSAGLGGGSVAVGGSVPSAATPGLFSGVSGLGALPLAGVAAGTYLGGEAAYDMLKGRKPGLPGRIVLGMATGGLSEVARPFLGQKSIKEIESDRWGGTGLAPEKYQDMIGKDYFAGTGGEQSRDEKFLTTDAIRNNPDNYNNAPDWDTWSKDQQDTFLKRMLDAGKVREKKGGIYYDDDFAKQTAAEIRNPAPQVKGAAPTQVPGEVIDAAAQNAFKGPKWIIRNGKTVKVA